jgi:endothelin-converting enzyme/putative endopeptidase
MRVLTSVLLLLWSCSYALAEARPLRAIEVADLDRKVDPCVDFYAFANGTWRANNPIPASMTRWSRRWQAGETSKEKLRDLLEAAAKDGGAAKGSPERLIGDYYGACMDEPRVDARGFTPLQPWFARIDGIKDAAGLQQMLIELHDVGVIHLHCEGPGPHLAPEMDGHFRQR